MNDFKYINDINNEILLLNTNVKFESYDIQVLLKNNLELLIPFKYVISNNESILKYNITNLKKISKELNYETTIKILDNLFILIKELSEYMLNIDNICVDIENIYFYNDKVKFIYVPNFNKNIEKQISDFLENIMDYIDYESPELVSVVYGLYKYINNSNAKILEINNYFELNYKSKNIKEKHIVIEKLEEQDTYDYNIENELDKVNKDVEFVDNSLEYEYVENISNDKIQENNKIYLDKKINSMLFLIDSIVCFVIYYFNIVYDPILEEWKITRLIIISVIIIIVNILLYNIKLDNIINIQKNKLDKTTILNSDKTTMLNDQTVLLKDKKYYLLGKINIELTTFPIVIGKETVRGLNNENSISRKHIELTNKNGSIYLKDLNSSNGTYINGEKIENNKKVKLFNNDSIKLANSIFIFREK